jgi:hypothetical protein
MPPPEGVASGDIYCTVVQQSFEFGKQAITETAVHARRRRRRASMPRVPRRAAVGSGTAVNWNALTCPPDPSETKPTLVIVGFVV